MIQISPIDVISANGKVPRSASSGGQAEEARVGIGPILISSSNFSITQRTPVYLIRGTIGALKAARKKQKQFE
jgi:hypothetical protein